MPNTHIYIPFRQAAMDEQTTQGVLSRRCIIIELERTDQEQIVKYLHEHVYSYNWLLREDKGDEKIRLCVWWREDCYRRFCTSPLRSFLKRLKNKGGYVNISRELTTKEGVHAFGEGILGGITKYYAEGPLYIYLRDLLSLESSPIETYSPEKEKCNRILQTASTLSMPAKLDLLQNFASLLVPEVKQKLEDKPQVPEVEQKLQDESHIIPEPPSPLITEPGTPLPPFNPMISEHDVFLPSTFPPSPLQSGHIEGPREYPDANGNPIKIVDYDMISPAEPY